MAQSKPLDFEDLQKRMRGAVQTLKHEFAGLRTGRASVSLLEPVHVDAYGSSMPLSQVGTVNAPEPRMLTVQVWDRGLVIAVDKAIRSSGLLVKFPEIDLGKNRVGIFSKPVPLDTVVRDKDRVEIYRPLIADPKEIRRQRAKAGKSMKKGGE